MIKTIIKHLDIFRIIEQIITIENFYNLFYIKFHTLRQITLVLMYKNTKQIPSEILKSFCKVLYFYLKHLPLQYNFTF